MFMKRKFLFDGLIESNSSIESAQGYSLHYLFTFILWEGKENEIHVRK